MMIRYDMIFYGECFPGIFQAKQESWSAGEALCSLSYEDVFVTCVSVWAKAVPCVASSVHVSML